MNPSIGSRGAIEVHKRVGKDREISDEIVSFPYGEDLLEEVQRNYNLNRMHPSTAVKRFADAQGVDLRDVIDTLLGDEDLGSVAVSRFLTHTGLRPLFSPIVEDGLRLGLARVEAQWEALIARTLNVDGFTYEYFGFNNGSPASPSPTGTAEFKLKHIGQGAPIPTARVTVSGKSYTMYKQGRGIEWTDESKQAPIDLAALWFQQVGLQLGWDYHASIVEMLLNGYFDDGSDDAPVLPTATPAVITDVDLLTAQTTMQVQFGYTPKVMLMSQSTAIEVETMENSTGAYRIFPNGVEAAGLPPITVSPEIPDDKVLFVDTDFAMVRFVNKAFGTEFDRSVQTQVEGSYGTEISLTAPLFKNARLILDS